MNEATTEVKELTSSPPRINKIREHQAVVESIIFHLLGMLFIFGVIVMLCALIYLKIFDGNESKLRDAIPLIMGFGFIVAFGATLSMYLDPNADDKIVANRRTLIQLLIKNDVLKEDLEIARANLQNSSASAQVQRKAVDFADTGSSENYSPLGENSTNQDNTLSIDKSFQDIISRLIRETSNQARRGNVNLILGILCALAGLGFLAYTVTYPPNQILQSELLMYFASRASLVLLIEILAYFFLRLYKQSLAEIKYFQNEITNIETRQIAFQCAKEEIGTELKAKIIDEFLRTERNFLMSKDQTTVDIEKERLSRSTYSDLINAVKDLGRKRD